MALSADDKREVFELLAAGKNASEVAKAVGCSRGTIQRLKKQARDNPLLKMVQGVTISRQIASQGDEVLNTLAVMKEREPQIQQGLWLMYEGFNELVAQVLESTTAEDISPRQLPAFAKAMVEISNSYVAFSDRINGLELLADEVYKINEKRSA